MEDPPRLDPTRQHVAALNRELAERYSLNSRRLLTLALRRFLTLAEADGILPKGTVAEVRVPRPKKSTGVAPTPDRDAVRTLLQEVIADSAPAAVLVLLAATSGARRGELVGARFSDIDFTEGIWRIQRSVTYANGELHVDAPKTEAARRAVPLSPLVLDALRRARAASTADSDSLAPAVTPDNLSDYYARIARRHSIPTGLHSLRRFVASEVLSASGDIATVADLLGHSSTETTRRHYVVADVDRVKQALSAVVFDLADVAAS